MGKFAEEFAKVRIQPVTITVSFTPTGDTVACGVCGAECAVMADYWGDGVAYCDKCRLWRAEFRNGIKWGYHGGDND